MCQNQIGKNTSRNLQQANKMTSAIDVPMSFLRHCQSKSSGSEKLVIKKIIEKTLKIQKAGNI